MDPAVGSHGIARPVAAAGADADTRSTEQPPAGVVAATRRAISGTDGHAVHAGSSTDAAADADAHADACAGLWLRLRLQLPAGPGAADLGLRGACCRRRDVAHHADNRLRMDGEAVRIEHMEPGDRSTVRDLLVALTLEEQQHFDHPRETAEEVAQRLPVTPTFAGENHYLVARGEAGAPLGLCWVAFFDPGNGLEAEIAELYVRPDARGNGVATRLVSTAMDLIRSRGVTFASVWTRPDNEAAIAVYRAAGFRPTEQTVLTWLPL